MAWERGNSVWEVNDVIGQAGSELLKDFDGFRCLRENRGVIRPGVVQPVYAVVAYKN